MRAIARMIYIKKKGIFMVVSDFTTFFMLILNKIVVNPLFIVIYEIILVLILIRITMRLFHIC